MAKKRPAELRITDPLALRALAHPARQRLITEFFSGEVLTATEAAALVDLTPSATSYHLRALEKWGIVERDASTDDARERPWRSSADSISILPSAYAKAGHELSRSSLSKWLVDLDAGLDRLAESLDSLDHTLTADPSDDQPTDRAGSHREGTGMTSRTRVWLTDAELAQLRDELAEVIRSHEGRTRRNHPDDARPWDVYALVLPAE